MKPLGILALVTTMLVVAGCDDEFLTEVPSDFVAPENFYRNADDALAAVNAAYASFVNLRSPLSNDDYYGRNFFMVTEFQTETITNRLSATNERSLVDNFHTQFLSTHPYIETIWQAAYSAQSDLGASAGPLANPCRVIVPPQSPDRSNSELACHICPGRS